MPSHVKPSKNLITRFEYFTVTSDSLTKTMFDRRDGKYEGWRGKGNEEGGRGVQKEGKESHLLLSTYWFHPVFYIGIQGKFLKLWKGWKKSLNPSILGGLDMVS